MLNELLAGSITSLSQSGRQAILDIAVHSRNGRAIIAFQAGSQGETPPATPLPAFSQSVLFRALAGQVGAVIQSNATETGRSWELHIRGAS